MSGRNASGFDGLQAMVPPASDVGTNTVAENRYFFSTGKAFAIKLAYASSNVSMKQRSGQSASPFTWRDQSDGVIVVYPIAESAPICFLNDSDSTVSPRQ